MIVQFIQLNPLHASYGKRSFPLFEKLFQTSKKTAGNWMFFEREGIGGIGAGSKPFEFGIRNAECGMFQKRNADCGMRNLTSWKSLCSAYFIEGQGQSSEFGVASSGLKT